MNKEYYYPEELVQALQDTVRPATLEDLCFVLGVPYQNGTLPSSVTEELSAKCMQLQDNSVLPTLGQPERLSIIRAATEFIGSIFLVAVQQDD